MAVEFHILMNNYGISEEFAKRLLDFTRNDLEGAIQILESSEQDVYAVQMKFLSSKKMAYGAILLFYNLQNHVPEFIYAAVSGDSRLSKLNIDLPWNEYLAEMSGFMMQDGADFDTASRIENEILHPDNIKYIIQFFYDKNNPDVVNFKRFILSHLSKVMLDTAIVLKVQTSPIDVFKYKNTLSQFKSGLKIVPKEGKDLTMLINMHIEPVLAPIGGTDIDKMNIGDEILVKIADERDVVTYLGQLLDFVDDAGLNKALYGKVVKHVHNAESQNHMVTLEFGPGIYGTFSVGQKVRVQSRVRTADTSAAPTVALAPSPLDDINGPNPAFGGTLDDLPGLKSGATAPMKKKSNLFIIINIILLAIIAIIIFFMLFSP